MDKPLAAAKHPCRRASGKHAIGVFLPATTASNYCAKSMRFFKQALDFTQQQSAKQQENKAIRKLEDSQKMRAF